VAKAITDKRFAWIPSTAAAVAVLLVGVLVFPGLTGRIENALYDRALRSNDQSPARDLVIVAIDDASTSRLGAWPWPQSIHAKLLQKMQDASVPLVAFTMPFGDLQNTTGLQQLRAAIDLLSSNELANSEQGEQLRKLLDSSVADLDQSALLANAIANHGNVILPIEAHAAPANSDATQLALEAAEKLSGVANDKTYISGDADILIDMPPPVEIHTPAPSLAAHARSLGHVALTTDRDRVLRTDTASLRIGDHLLPSMAIAIAAAMQGIESPQINIDDRGLLSIGNKRLQLDDQLRWRPAIYPASGPLAIRQVSYWQVLSGDVDPESLRGKTVLVGIVGPSMTPGSGSSEISTPLGVAMAPVQLIASTASSVRLDHVYRHPGWALAVEVLIALGIVALAATLLPRMGVSIAAIGGSLLVIALILVEIGLLNLAGVWVKLTLPALAVFGAVIGLSGKSLFKRMRAPRGHGADAVESLRMLGLTFQGQGQLDLAYETFRRCPNDTQSMDLLYLLGQDYERRRQFNKASEVYAHVASVDLNYKDIVQRRDRMKRADIAQSAAPLPAARPAVRTTTSSEPPMVPGTHNTQSGGKQTLGRYEIERELGKGAMGVVYLGRDPKINRVVAIKAIALAEEFADDDLADARARFFREAEMAGRLNHPGIVTVYDAGEDRGLAYIAMEYLRGEHLSHYAEPIYLLPVARVLSLAARVADALDYAHKQNVVHRDIKPANIMFNKDTDELKLTDFGIARLTDTSRTKTGIVLGTPSFMSPEQLEGRPLDGRSDLFGLGITLYQLLTGQLPFRADSMTRLMQKIATEEHVPLRSLRPELPDMAEQIVSRALAKSAVDRYQTGAEMAVALRACLRLATRKEAIAR
jgi:CHASE2 domain-containing sensor protein